MLLKPQLKLVNLENCYKISRLHDHIYYNFITNLPKVIWEEGRVAAKVSDGAV